MKEVIGATGDSEEAPETREHIERIMIAAAGGWLRSIWWYRWLSARRRDLTTAPWLKRRYWYWPWKTEDIDPKERQWYECRLQRGVCTLIPFALLFVLLSSLPRLGGTLEAGGQLLARLVDSPAETPLEGRIYAARGGELRVSSAEVGEVLGMLGESPTRLAFLPEEERSRSGSPEELAPQAQEKAKVPVLLAVCHREREEREDLDRDRCRRARRLLTDAGIHNNRIVTIPAGDAYLPEADPRESAKPRVQLGLTQLELNPEELR